MITDKGRFKCDHCGRFISSQDGEAFHFTPFGSVVDSEPPEPSEVCGACKPEYEPYAFSPDRVWIPAERLFVRSKKDGKMISYYIHEGE